MPTHLMRKDSPEDIEIAAKQAELSALEARFAEQELKFATAQAEIRSFERRYVAKLGALFARLDGIEAEIAEIDAKLHPRDSEKERRANHAKTRAQESAEDIRDARNLSPAPDFTPSADLKKLYRQAAMRIHPDLSAYPADAPNRERVMAEVNDAYQAGDESRLRDILRDWESRPEAVAGDGPGAKLIRIIRKIAQVKTALANMEHELATLHESEIAQLRLRSDQAALDGGDLLEDMAKNLDHQINAAGTRLSKMRVSAKGK